MLICETLSYMLHLFIWKHYLYLFCIECYTLDWTRGGEILTGLAHYLLFSALHFVLPVPWFFLQPSAPDSDYTTLPSEILAQPEK